MLAARKLKLQSEHLEDPSADEGHILSRLVCYTSKLVDSLQDASFSRLILPMIYLGSFVCRKGRSDRYG